MENINDYWSMNEGAFACLHDSKRTLAFRKAIRNSVKKGDVVLELGAGTGVLSMFAVDAGASKVYAIELDKGNIQTLKQVISDNGYSKKIEVIHDDAVSVKIPGKVDYIICEMVATGLIEELQVPAMNNALSFLKPGGRVLLSKYETCIELVYSKNHFYNKIFNITRFELPEMRDMRSQPYSKRVVFNEVDLTKKTTRLRLSKHIVVPIEKTGIINGIKLYGQTTFADGSKFYNSTAYDFPIILPVEEIPVTKGDNISLSLDYKLSGGPKSLKYKIKKL